MSDLDPLIHAPVRLRLVVTLSTLAEGDSLTFPRLQELLELTPGNLVTHLRKLEDGGYVVSEKKSERKGSSTAVHLTMVGRAALESYMTTLHSLIDGVAMKGVKSV